MSKLDDLLKKQAELEELIALAKEEEKEKVKQDFEQLIEKSNFSRSEVLEILGFAENKGTKKSSASKPSTKIDLASGTILTNGEEEYMVGTRGKRPLWVAEAVESGSVEKLVKK